MSMNYQILSIHAAEAGLATALRWYSAPSASLSLSISLPPPAFLQLTTKFDRRFEPNSISLVQAVLIIPGLFDYNFVNKTANRSCLFYLLVFCLKWCLYCEYRGKPVHPTIGQMHHVLRSNFCAKFK